MCTEGPRFETAAEIAMFKQLGAFDWHDQCSGSMFSSGIGYLLRQYLHRY